MDGLGVVGQMELIDISSYQDATPIDWNQVKSFGVSGVVVKITEGTSYVNPGAAHDIAGARAAGLGVCGYLFFHPSVDPIAQADYYLNNGGNALPGVWIDAEVTDGANWSQIATDLQRCHDYLSSKAKPCGLYDNVSWTNNLGDESWGWYLWLADPSNSAPQDNRVNWQYGTSTVPGITGQVDRDRWVGSDSVYQAFFGGSVQPQPKPTPVVLGFSVSSPIADQAVWPSGGILTLTEDGAVFAVKGAPYYGGANGQAYFQGRSAARLDLSSDGGYSIVDTAGETYHYPPR